MAAATQLPVFQALDIKLPASQVASPAADAAYWWNTSGSDLANMLQEADYPEEVQRSFLSWYRDNICTVLGGRPDANSGMAGIGRDGNPFEYSFEIKGSTKSQSVRFVVDLTELRPSDPVNPLGITTTQKMVDSLSKKTPGFDDTWYLALKKFFVLSHLSAEEQKALIAKSRFQSSAIIGFDIHKKATEEGRLPVMGKIYFLPHFAAHHNGLTYWQAARQSVLQLPGIEKFDNIIKSFNMINDYLADKPKNWQMGTRFLATDLVAPEKARFKVYMRCFGTTFEDIWDFYTLGGRIPNLDEDKEKFRDLMDMVSGTTYAESRSKDEMTMERYGSVENKLTACYFAISSERAYPGPKLCVYPANFAKHDEVIAKGLDQWFNKYRWHEQGVETRSMEDQVKSVFTHRDLKEKTGIFTFIGIGRKEDATKKNLSMQVYVSPELYDNPRY